MIAFMLVQEYWSTITVGGFQKYSQKHNENGYLGGVWFLKVPRLILVIGLKILVPTCLVLWTKMD